MIIAEFKINKPFFYEFDEKKYKNMFKFKKIKVFISV